MVVLNRLADAGICYVVITAYLNRELNRAIVELERQSVARKKPEGTESERSFRAVAHKGRESTQLTIARATRVDVCRASAMLAALALYELPGPRYGRGCFHLARCFAAD
jgi:hypothetical protein